MAEVIRETRDGFACAGLRNDAVELLIVPQLGAKLISLINRATGRQWMWQSGKLPQLFDVPTGCGFADGPLLGADECLPTIAPCRWDGRDLPDHGEAWTEAWSLDDDALADGRLVTLLDLPISPLTIERAIHIDGSAVRFDYALANRSDCEQAYLWAFHPMMAIEPGDRIELPPSVTSVRTEQALGDTPLGDRGDIWSWPTPKAGIDFASLDLGGPDRAVKLFTEPLTVGHAAIVNDRTGDRVTFAFDAGELNTLGIWINRGGFDGYQHIALEPTNGAPDALDLAVNEWGRCASVAAGATKRWGFTLSV